MSVWNTCGKLLESSAQTLSPLDTEEKIENLDEKGGLQKREARV